VAHQLHAHTHTETHMNTRARHYEKRWHCLYFFFNIWIFRYSMCFSYELRHNIDYHTWFNCLALFFWVNIFIEMHSNHQLKQKNIQPLPFSLHHLNANHHSLMIPLTSRKCVSMCECLSDIDEYVKFYGWGDRQWRRNKGWIVNRYTYTH